MCWRWQVSETWSINMHGSVDRCTKMPTFIRETLNFISLWMTEILLLSVVFTLKDCMPFSWHLTLLKMFWNKMQLLCYKENSITWHIKKVLNLFHGKILRFSDRIKQFYCGSIKGPAKGNSIFCFKLYAYPMA